MYDWRETILKPNDTIEKAIQVLNREALGIVMVANNDGSLLGTVTDGDIRRALVRHYGIDAALVNVMRRNPITATVEENHRAKILGIMRSKGLLQMPILDEDRKIVGLETLHHLLDIRKYDNPVFLMAGGFGTRLQPLTDDTPKPLLNVGSKPIMEIILEQFIEYGFHNFFISTHYKAEMVRDYFGDGDRWDVKIDYVHEDEPLGTAGCLGMIKDKLPNLPVIVMNADLLTKVNFSQLLNYHIEQGGIATMCTREYDFQVPYGVVQVEGYSVTGIIEKPVHKFFVNAGIYVLNPSLFDSIDGYSYTDMPNFLEDQIKMNKQVNTFPIHEYWLDIGHLEEFERANREIFTTFNI